MDLKQLQYFASVVEEGNITAAARRLHISQPPLSQQLKSLEEELGITLFWRGARKVTLTEAGRVLYQQACNILELTEATVKQMEDLKSGVTGTLRLGTISSSGSALLNRRMIRFHKHYPGVRFELFEGNTFQLIELLEAGLIEIAVVRTPFETKNIGHIFLEREPMMAVGTAEHLGDIAQETISLKQLLKKPLIYYRRFEQLIDAAFQSEGLKLEEVFCKNDDARTSLMWANAGLGVALVPRSALNIISGPEMIAKKIASEQMETQIAAIWKKDHYFSAICRHFLETFQEG